MLRSLYSLALLTLISGSSALGYKGKDWPCPVAEDILPCICGYEAENLLTPFISCTDVPDIDVIREVFTKPFPFNNLDSVYITIQGQEVWGNSTAVRIPENIFSDKSFRRIYIVMKVEDVHNHAFDASKDRLEDLILTGPGRWMGYETIELEYFPIYMLEDFPNLIYCRLQWTNLKDDTFAHHFDQLKLPNLEILEIIESELTHVPKFPRLPKLKELHFGNHLIASIAKEAFSDLESLEWLDLSSAGKNQTLTHLDTDTLKLGANNLTKLDFQYFNSLTSFAPNFISNFSPNLQIDFYGDNVVALEEDVFKPILETLLAGDGFLGMGRNPLLCDCSIAWLVYQPELIGVLDRSKYDLDKVRCSDGRRVADLDPNVFADLCGK